MRSVFCSGVRFSNLRYFPSGRRACSTITDEWRIRVADREVRFSAEELRDPVSIARNVFRQTKGKVILDLNSQGWDELMEVLCAEMRRLRCEVSH